MSSLCYGLIAEGDKDVAVYRELIIKICGTDPSITTQPTGGKASLLKKLPGFLSRLEHCGPIGEAVDKALVIRDADGKDPSTIEQKIKERIGNRPFRFALGIGIHVVVQEMDTWLLADTDAINRVAASRGGKPVRLIPDSLEQIQDPKARLQILLGKASLNYTPEVCRLIAKETDLATLRKRCPSFRQFETKVLDP